MRKAVLCAAFLVLAQPLHAAVDFQGTGSPEGVVTASPGALYLRTDGESGTTLYVKVTGTGDSGWMAIDDEPESGDFDNLIGGAGILVSGATVSSASTEPAWLNDGGAISLSCGSSNQGKAQVMNDGTLQYCDGASTSVLRTFNPNAVDDDVPESGDFTNLTGGAGIQVSGGTVSSASTEPSWLTDGGATSLTCGASNQGKSHVLDNGNLEYCDGASTSVLRTFNPSANTVLGATQATSTTSSISGLDNPDTIGGLSLLRGCSDRAVLSYNGSSGTWGCTTPLTCVTYIPWGPCDDTGTTACATSATDPCFNTTADIGATGTRLGQPFAVDMDLFTYAKLMWAGGYVDSAGTITVALHNHSTDTDDVTDTMTGTAACTDRTDAATDLSAKTGIDYFSLELGSSTTTDDPALTAIVVMFCNGPF